MTFYIIILSIFICLSCISVYKKDAKWIKYAFNFCVILLIIHDGLRWETGTDWDLYKVQYRAEAQPIFEFGYNLINTTFFKLGVPYSLFILFIAVLCWSFYGMGIYKLSPLPILTLFIFYCSCVGYLGMNRQHIALCLCLFSLTFVVKRQIIPFAICILTACLFHQTAILFSVTYFLTKEIKHKYIFGVLFATIFINALDIPMQLLNGLRNFEFMPSKILFRLDRYTALLSTEDFPIIGSIIGICRRMVIFIPLLILKDELKNKYPNFTLFFNIYCISLGVFFLFNNCFQLFVSRANLYFDLLSVPFLITSFVLYFEEKWKKALIVCAITLYSILIFNKQISVHRDLFVPYKSLYYNQDFKRKMY